MVNTREEWRKGSYLNVSTDCGGAFEDIGDFVLLRSNDLMIFEFKEGGK